MHERRNTVLTLLFAVALIWCAFAWLCVAVFPALTHIPPSTDAHRYGSLAAVLVLAAILAYVHLLEEKMPDKLAEIGSGKYFEQDGLCFMPVLRVTDKRSTTSSGFPASAQSGTGLSGTGSRLGAMNDPEQQAEISLYYQNRYEGECEAVIHIRPPAGVFFSHKGARDVHFAFRAQPGAFGVIHQPVAIAHAAQGTPVSVQIAAMVRWVRHRGDVLRTGRGLPVGTFQVDWALAYRQGKHELCGELELTNPARLTLNLPDCVAERVDRSEFVNETLMVKS